MAIRIESTYCEIREAVLVLTKRLAHNDQETFADFEEAIDKNVKKPPTLDGTVHPLTSYVINYVMFLFRYRSTLKQILGELGVADGEEQLGSTIKRIVEALQSNLDKISKQCKDHALTHIFLMNNIHYIVGSVNRSEVKDLFGNDWLQRQRRVVQQHANLYKMISCSEVLAYLLDQELHSIVSGCTASVSKREVKDKFKTFNVLFEKLHHSHSQYIVCDRELREKLRLSLAEVLLRAYRPFIRRFGPLIQGGKNPEQHIKYSAEELERMFGELFESRT